MFQECEYEISQKGELVAKLENKTREISQMLNNLNKITTTPVKKKKHEINSSNKESKEEDRQEEIPENYREDIKIVIDKVEESKTK